MLELNPKTKQAGFQTEVAHKQRGQLLIALAILLVVLAVVLVKDRGFWFGSDETMEAADASEGVPTAASASVPAKVEQTSPARDVATKNHPARKALTEPAAVSLPHTNSANPDSPTVVTNRAVLPPLVVEVVAGDKHSTVHPGSNVAKVEIPSASSRPTTLRASMTSLPMNAAAHERLVSETTPDFHQSIESPYPALGQHTRVQGTVVLQAIVRADGSIQDLRVLSGPAILSSAAQEAVRQWRFKPYMENGEAVETVAKITVNFTIRVQESSS
jgi:TonB family protein